MLLKPLTDWQSSTSAKPTFPKVMQSTAAPLQKNKEPIMADTTVRGAMATQLNAGKKKKKKTWS